MVGFVIGYEGKNTIQKKPTLKGEQRVLFDAQTKLQQKFVLDILKSLCHYTS